MVIFATFNNGSEQIKDAYIYMSDEERHGWYSAIPAYSHFVKTRKSELKDRYNIDLKLNVLFSDRGPSDFWCAPFIYYAADIAKSENVSIIPATTASGHGKFIHDQIGGGTKSTSRHALKNGYIKIKSGESIADKIVEYLNENYSESFTGFKRNFHVLKPDEINYRESPIQSFIIGTKGGITQFHCCSINKSGKIQFRKYLCVCNECIVNEFAKNCGQTAYCGKWLDIKPIKFKSKSPKQSKSSINKSISPQKPRKPQPKKLCGKRTVSQYQAQNGYKNKCNKSKKQKVTVSNDCNDDNPAIPSQLQQYTWLYDNCNALTISGRKVIIDFLLNKIGNMYNDKHVMDIPIHKWIKDGEHKTRLFRCWFKTKRWKLVVCTRKARN